MRKHKKNLLTAEEKEKFNNLISLFRTETSKMVIKYTLEKASLNEISSVTGTRVPLLYWDIEASLD